MRTYAAALAVVTAAVIADSTAWQLRANEALQPELPRQIFLWAGVVLLAACAVELYHLRRER